MNNEERADAITLYISNLVKGSTDFSSEKKYLCPVCNHVLRIQTGKYQRFDREMLGLMVECKDCDISMALDFELS